jgi:hypothetical protein
LPPIRGITKGNLGLESMRFMVNTKCPPALATWGADILFCNQAVVHDHLQHCVFLI